MSTEPTGSKIVSVQLAFGKDDPRTLDEITASVKDMLGQLDPKRVTIMDEYWLVNGVRTTRADRVQSDIDQQAAAKAPAIAELFGESAATSVASKSKRGPTTAPLPKLDAAISARSCREGCGTVCTKDNADQNDDGSWSCHTCQAAA